MLREEITELLMDLEGQPRPMEDLKIDIISLLEDEDVDVEEWPEKIDLKKILNLNSEASIRLTAARILYQLDVEGVDIVGSGYLDDDEEWERYNDILDQE